MSKLLQALHEKHVPKFNPLIANGVSIAQVSNALEYVDTVFKIIASGFPEGLTYEGYRKATVQEEYKTLSRIRGGQQSIELARSSTFLTNFYFKYKGEDIPPKGIFIPYLEKGGTMYLRGKLFTVVPVMADPTLSVAKSNGQPGNEEIFVPFISAKVTFKRELFSYFRDGTRQTDWVVYSKIHNHNPKSQPRREQRANLNLKCNSSMALYLFGKFGVHETFKRYANANVIVLNGEVDRNIYPESEWSVCEVNPVVPKCFKRNRKVFDYEFSDLKLLVPAKMKDSNIINGLVSGFMYTLQFFPQRITAETIDGTEDEIRLWRILLGHIIFLNKDTEGDLLKKINEHYFSLDRYLDDLTKKGLEDDGYPAEDIYDLMMYIISDFTTIVMRDVPASIFGKELAVNRYLLADIVKAISVFKFNIQKIKDRDLTAKDISTMLNRTLKPEVIFNDTRKHSEIISNQCAGDNLMFNYTSKVISQDKATNATNGSNGTNPKDASKLLDVSIAIAGSILFLPKSEPTGRSAINPYLQMNRSFRIKCPENMKEVANHIQHQIQGD